ncbi:Protein trichome birefringence-like 34 [Abeliophyllum distichum]|uniref:Protein trichome birefringence-like 34 n=1 Tax=Abeliophyllum distichum TaxID=126358 RepID=A0ABD1VYW4_9LAMI
MANMHKLVLGTWKIRYKFHFIAGILLIAFVIAALYTTGYSRIFLEQQTTPNDSIPYCDLFSGKWVYDNISYPLYKEQQCFLVEDAFACEKYGRKDLKYQKWRWQPHDCDLPRFNATALMENLWGKKLVFVGDSLNRNQFGSMLCLIEPAIPPTSSKSLIWKGNSVIFNATDYNATIEFYWSPLLVESNCDDIADHRVQTRIIRVKAIEKHARQWTDADILVFDSFMWWLKPNMTLLWGLFGSSDAIFKEVGMRQLRYEMALNTCRGEDWGMETGQNCYNETDPILNNEYWGSATDREMMQIVESAIHKLETRGLKVEYLNITQLSDYRKDAHPSVHRRFWVPLTE